MRPAIIERMFETVADAEAAGKPPGAGSVALAGLPLVTRADGTLDLAATARALADAQPGPGSVAALTVLGPATMSPLDRVNLLTAYEKAAAWLAAGQTRVLAALGREPVSGDEDWTREEVSAALGLSASAAQDRLDVARALEHRLPATWAALAEGRINYLHAKVIAEETRALDDEPARRVEDRVLRRAEGCTVGQLRRATRRAAIAADPAGADERHERARRNRRVESFPLPEAMAGVYAVLGADEAATVRAALDGLADRNKRIGRGADEPGIDSRRADALVELCADALDRLDLPHRHGQLPRPRVTLGVQRADGEPVQAAELAGYGPVPDAIVMRLGNRADVRPGDAPTGGPHLDYGRRTYRPPADLARYIVARDVHCTFPTCSTPADRCDLDHRTPWEQGGETSRANLGAACRHHHRAKTIGGWTVEGHPDESCTWISPSGLQYHVNPPGRGPD